jgi:hypothetical protein
VRSSSTLWAMALGLAACALVVLPAPRALAQPSPAGSSTPSATPAPKAPQAPKAPKPPAPPKAPEPLAPLALSIAVAVDEGSAVVGDEWLATEVREANRLLGPHGVQVRPSERRSLGASFVAIETAEDRDRLAGELARAVVNVFVVRSLRDVDKPDHMILGVRWRQRRNTDKDYVILSSIASPTTLAHELGHFLGLGHSPVDNNAMSYRRSDPSAVAFDARQGTTMLATARRLVRSKRIATVQPVAPAAAPAATTAAVPDRAPRPPTP